MAIYVLISFRPSLTEINDGNTLEAQRSPAEYHLPTVDCQSPSVKHVFSRCLQLNFQSCRYAWKLFESTQLAHGSTTLFSVQLFRIYLCSRLEDGQEWITPLGGSFTYLHNPLTLWVICLISKLMMVNILNLAWHVKGFNLFIHLSILWKSQINKIIHTSKVQCVWSYMCCEMADLS